MIDISALQAVLNYQYKQFVASQYYGRSLLGPLNYGPSQGWVIQQITSDKGTRNKLLFWSVTAYNSNLSNQCNLPYSNKTNAG